MFAVTVVLYMYMDYLDTSLFARWGLIYKNDEFSVRLICSTPHYYMYYPFFFSPSGDNMLSTRLSEIYQHLEAIEADKAPAKAAVILAGLGFTPRMQKMPTKWVLHVSQ